MLKNNKGFTLVELLAVLVILIAIMAIAIPTINSSMERTKQKQKNAKIKMIEAAAELYVADNRNKVYSILGEDKEFVYICISDLEKYLSDDATIDSDNNQITGAVKFFPPNDYKFEEDNDNNDCME